MRCARSNPKRARNESSCSSVSGWVFPECRSRPPMCFDETFITTVGDFRTLPSFWADRGGSHGFYAARLRAALVR